MSVWRDGGDIVRLNAAAGDHPVPVSPDVRDALVTRIRSASGRAALLTSPSPRSRTSGVRHAEQGQHRPRCAGPSGGLINYRDLQVDEKPAPPFSSEGHAREPWGSARATPSTAPSVLRKRGLEYQFKRARTFTSRSEGRPAVATRHHDPRGPRTKSSRRWISQTARSASGDYERFFLKDGRRYHPHRRPRGAARAGVQRELVTDRAVIADALARACSSWGGSRHGADQRLPHVENVVVSARTGAGVVGLRTGSCGSRKPTVTTRGIGV